MVERRKIVLAEDWQALTQGLVRQVESLKIKLAIAQEGRAEAESTLYCATLDYTRPEREKVIIEELPLDEQLRIRLKFFRGDNND